MMGKQTFEKGTRLLVRIPPVPGSRARARRMDVTVLYERSDRRGRQYIVAAAPTGKLITVFPEWILARRRTSTSA